MYVCMYITLRSLGSALYARNSFIFVDHGQSLYVVCAAHATVLKSTQ